MSASIFFLGLATLLIALGVWLQKRTKKMHTWVSTQGEVMASSYEERKHQEGFSSGRYYKPHVCYQFTVGGRIFTGRNFSSQNFTIGLKEEAQELMAIFPPGKAVVVYFDPAEPNKSVLELPNYTAAHAFLTSGCAVALITLLILACNRP